MFVKHSSITIVCIDIVRSGVYECTPDIVYRYSITIMCMHVFQLALEGLRLVGSSYNHTGRAEVQYNDTWGAVCGSQLPSQTAKAVCR